MRKYCNSVQAFAFKRILREVVSYTDKEYCNQHDGSGKELRLILFTLSNLYYSGSPLYLGGSKG